MPTPSPPASPSTTSSPARTSTACARPPPTARGARPLRRRVRHRRLVPRRQAGDQAVAAAGGPQSGLTLSDLARQVRNAFYGVEAQRIQRGQDEVRVMVRYPGAGAHVHRQSRRHVHPHAGRLRGALLQRRPLRIGRGYSSIRRVDGRRVVNVTADVDRSQVSPEEVNASIQRQVLPALMRPVPRHRDRPVRGAGGARQGHDRARLRRRCWR
jgi:hypothetical protein